LGKTLIVGEGCTISKEIRLVDTVLGDGAVITGHGRLERCVVLPGARLDADSNYADAIVTRNGVLQAD
jgi:ADP-glucose pyrophosphorylase